MLIEKLKNQVVMTPEFLAAELSNADIDVAALKTDANGYVKKHYNVEVLSDLNIVENSQNIVHISLPYYDGLEQAAELFDDEELENASAGFVGAIIGVIAAAFVATIVVGSVVSTIAVTEVNKKDGNK